MIRRLLSFRVIALIVVLTVGIAVYFFVDPAETSWMPQCVFRRITGLDCPGCGSQRMIHALLHGDLAKAWHQNAFLILSLPYLAVLGIASAAPHRFPRLFRTVHSPAVIIIFAILIIFWTIFRNAVI